MGTLLAKPLVSVTGGSLEKLLLAFGTGADSLPAAVERIRPAVITLYDISAGQRSLLARTAPAEGGDVLFPAVEVALGANLPQSILVGSRAWIGSLAARLAESGEEGAGELSAALDCIINRQTQLEWKLAGGCSLDLTSGARIMGVLNLTTDSFYGGSRVPTIKEAVRRAEEMLDQGADIIDVGGESTRPGAMPVGEEEEAERVVPVVRELALSHPEMIISVDTYKASVARAAVAAGARIINDIGAGLLDERMFETVSTLGAGYVMMHMRGVPRSMQQDTEYDDLLAEIYRFFAGRLEQARKMGIDPARIVIDPGIGFGKPAAGNFEIISRLSEFAPLGRPVMVGPSRKSFLSLAGLASPEDRLEGTLAACTVAVQAGAHVLRVHDVGSVKKNIAAAARFAGIPAS
ncbi:MAG: dihydropteroate synthase [Candidatus Glassbacteria bacterium]